MGNKAPYSIDVNIFKMQYIAIFGSVVLLIFILNLIRRKRIKEEYSLLWLLLSIVFLVFSVWREGLDFISRLMGVAYPPAALFLILLMAIFMILIQFSIIISKQAENNKNLTQEHGLLKFDHENLQKRVKNLEDKLKE